jgi:hypothetical protein
MISLDWPVSFARTVMALKRKRHGKPATLRKSPVKPRNLPADTIGARSAAVAEIMEQRQATKVPVHGR